MHGPEAIVFRSIAPAPLDPTEIAEFALLEAAQHRQMLLLQLVGKAHSPVFHGRRVGRRAKRFDRRVRRRLYYRGIAVTIRARILCRASRQTGAQGNSKSNQYIISQCDDVSWSVLAERH